MDGGSVDLTVVRGTVKGQPSLYIGFGASRWARIYRAGVWRPLSWIRNGMKAGPRLCSKPGGVGDTGLAAGRLRFLGVDACVGLAGRLASGTCPGRPPRP
jgi:hypothetical protein